MSDTRLDGKVAIVTGAAQGLGKAEALALAAEGARLVLNDLPGDALEATAEEIRAAGGEATTLGADVADWNTGEGLVKTALATYGSLEILVNNAGFTRDRMLFNMSEEEWDSVVRVHLKGHFVTSRHAVSYWRGVSKTEGGNVYGRIINTSSEAFLLGSPGQPNYAAAKGGITALTLSTAHAVGRIGVRVNAICPRARTGMTAAVFGAAPETGPDPLGAEHVSPLVAYLASPAADSVNAQVFVVYGGVVAVMAPPTTAQVVRAEGTWTPAALAEALEVPQGGFSANAALKFD
ncbi:SDR family NAD(P)-dependent oxidoreductase [Actinocorallia longicatena]|uniref:3-oxoacyl-ACP reductase n=1 Tax=Actinocorallia longicatena TaxID=111803 RepID=A0ABP6Q2M8_9ACTN